MEMLRSYGFNGLGAWSEVDVVRVVENPLIYTVIVSPMGEYLEDHRRSYKQSGWQGYRFNRAMVFDSKFDYIVKKVISRVAKYKDDKYLLGYYTDNEIPWVNDALDRHLTLLARDEPENKAYGVHGNSGYLFTFDPREKKVEIIDHITSEPSRKSGMFDQFSYGYLGFMIDKNGVIHYLTGTPIYEEGERVTGVDKINTGAAKGLEHLHIITYDIKKKYHGLGAVFYQDGLFPTYVNSIVLDDTGNIYTLAHFMHNEIEIEDLIKIELP